MVASQDAALARLRAKDFAGTLLRFVERGRCATPPRPAPEVAWDFWQQFEQFERLEELRQFRPARYQALPADPPQRAVAEDRRDSSRMIVNQWVPAAHSGDAIGDSARRVRDMLRARGPSVRPLRADDRRRPARRRAAVRRSGGAARRRDDLPLRAAVADDRGVRVAAGRPRPAVPQHHAGGSSSRPTMPGCSGWRRSAARSCATLVGRVDLALGDSEFNRQELEALGFAPTGVLPIAVNTERITSAPRRPALEKILARRPDQHPLRRPHRPEQADRGPHPAGRALQALRRQLLPLHLRRPLRRPAALLRAGPGADRRVPDAAGPLLVHRAGARRGPRRVLPLGGRLRLAERARRLLRAAGRGHGRRRAGAGLRGRGGARKRWAAPACCSRRRTSSSPPRCWACSSTIGPCGEAVLEGQRRRLPDFRAGPRSTARLEATVLHPSTGSQ